MKLNDNYKVSTDFHYRLITINVDEYMMVRLRAEQFPARTVKKFHERNAAPFQIRKKIN